MPKLKGYSECKDQLVFLREPVEMFRTTICIIVGPEVEFNYITVAKPTGARFSMSFIFDVNRQNWIFIN